jgi:hypothetical protein
MIASKVTSEARDRPAALSAADFTNLKELDRRVSVIRDWVRGVARRHHAGFYLFGRPGTSKTFTVRKTLAETEVESHYTNGYLTPLGLFDLLAEHPNCVIVLDDVSHLLTQVASLQILLAALGNREDAGARFVRYKRQGRERRVAFTGGLIFICNLGLHQGGLIQALKSRVHYLCHDPTDDQLAALMRRIACQGWEEKGVRLTPRECSQVAEFLIAESTRLNYRLDIRHLVEKGFPDFLQWRDGETESHWKDLVTTTLEEAVAELRHPLPNRQSRKEQLEEAHRIVRAILAEHESPRDRLAAWQEQTLAPPAQLGGESAESDNSESRQASNPKQDPGQPLADEQIHPLLDLLHYARPKLQPSVLSSVRGTG